MALLLLQCLDQHHTPYSSIHLSHTEYIDGCLRYYTSSSLTTMSATRFLSIRPLAGAAMRPGQLPIRQAVRNYSPIPPLDKKNDDLGGPYGQEPPNTEHRQKQNRYVSPMAPLIPPQLRGEPQLTGPSPTQAGGSPSARRRPSAWPSASSPSSPSSRRRGRSPSTRSRTTR